MRILRAYSALKTFSVSILAASLLAFSGAATIPAQAADNPASPPHNGRHIGNMQGVPVEITLNDVTVANGLTTVNFTIRDLRSSGDGKLISTTLSDGRTDAPKDDGAGREKGKGESFRPNGLTLTDPSTGKVYQVAHTADFECLCSGDPGNPTLYPGKSETYYATFAALPKETTSVIVTIPVGGAFVAVPVTHLDTPTPEAAWKPDGATEKTVKNPINAPVVGSIIVTGEKDKAASTAVAPGSVLTTLSGDVNFEVDSDQLTSRAKEILDQLAGEWAKKAPSEVTVTGHTDNVADDNHNMDLSKRRAKAVGDYLAAKVPGLKVHTDGKGETAPIADNNKDEGKAANRRVEIRAKE